MMARLPGTSSAAPRPCTTRAMMRNFALPATLQPIDATAKSAMPAMKTRRRPSWSPSAPPVRSNDERTIRYPSTIHCASVTVAPRERCSTGIAMLTTVPSMNAIDDPRIVAASVQRREGMGRGYQSSVLGPRSSDGVNHELRADDDVFGYGSGRRNLETIFPQAFNVKLDRLVHVLLRLFSSRSRRNTTGQVRRVRGEVCSGDFHHDEKAVHVHFSPACRRILS